eukprot:3312451-Amphidinium_carterae.1
MQVLQNADSCVLRCSLTSRKKCYQLQQTNAQCRSLMAVCSRCCYLCKVLGSTTWGQASFEMLLEIAVKLNVCGAQTPTAFSGKQARQSASCHVSCGFASTSRPEKRTLATLGSNHLVMQAWNGLGR